jgi:hypothetical protein
VWTFLRDRGSVSTSRSYRPAGPLGLLWLLCLLLSSSLFGGGVAEVVKGVAGSPPVVSMQRLRVARVATTQTFPSHLREGGYCGVGVYQIGLKIPSWASPALSPVRFANVQDSLPT